MLPSEQPGGAAGLLTQGGKGGKGGGSTYSPIRRPPFGFRTFRALNKHGNSILAGAQSVPGTAWTDWAAAEINYE